MFIEFVKKSIKAVLYRPIPQKIVIASSGRAGSTMLTQAVELALIKKVYRFSFLIKYLEGKFCTFIPRLDQLEKIQEKVIKTHDLFVAKESVKYIFIYADPLESALSVKKITKQMGKDWFARHQYHLHGVGDIEDLFTRDILNYEMQLRSWFSANSSNVLCVKYEELWESVDLISSFLNLDIVLPEKKERIKKEVPDQINEDLFEKLRLLKQG